MKVSHVSLNIMRTQIDSQQCDESKPTCGRCQRNQWECAYEASSVQLLTLFDDPHALDTRKLSPLKSTFVKCNNEELS